MPLPDVSGWKGSKGYVAVIVDGVVEEFDCGEGLDRVRC